MNTKKKWKGLGGIPDDEFDVNKDKEAAEAAALHDAIANAPVVLLFAAYSLLLPLRIDLPVSTSCGKASSMLIPSVILRLLGRHCKRNSRIEKQYLST
jgi:hypothetical protein